MVDHADPGFLGAVWRVSDFCQQFSAGSVSLQSLLKYCEALPHASRSLLFGKAGGLPKSSYPNTFHSETLPTPDYHIGVAKKCGISIQLALVAENPPNVG